MILYSAIVLFVIIGLIVLWAVFAYNALISLKIQIDNAWGQIDVQLKRRHDLIPNLVNVVKEAMAFEKSTLQAVIEARAKAAGAQSVPEAAGAENMLTQALGKLFALVENYPDLKSNANLMQLHEELASTENRIGFARQFYNDVVAQYNTKQAVFPTVIIASLMGFAKADFFEAIGAERNAPKVDFGGK
ncbi:MAG: LemA family protein [Deltaproteobacteria bacterium]|nr:LemA family protein [Deltaproteobacteria bacterium]